MRTFVCIFWILLLNKKIKYVCVYKYVYRLTRIDVYDIRQVCCRFVSFRQRKSPVWPDQYNQRRSTFMVVWSERLNGKNNVFKKIGDKYV